MFNLYGLLGAIVGAAARIIYGYVLLNGGKPFDVKYLRALVWGGLLGMLSGGFAMPAIDVSEHPLGAFLIGFGAGFAWTGASQIAVSSADRKAQ
jgi:hypothetical protein